MAETPSNMLALGTKAPDFTLPDTRSGLSMSLADFQSDKATVVMFICNHCPYVKHIDAKLVEVANKYQAFGVKFVAISSNDSQKFPADGPDKMQKEAEKCGYTFPYLFDETQAVAKAYQAACTPDFYVFDKNLECIYRGRFDDSTPGNNRPVTGKELSDALDCVLRGEVVNSDQKPSVGCNIKWKVAG